MTSPNGPLRVGIGGGVELDKVSKIIRWPLPRIGLSVAVKDDQLGDREELGQLVEDVIEIDEKIGKDHPPNVAAIAKD